VGLLEDMLSALDRIPGWKRLQGIPDEVDALKTRVSSLEEKLNGKWPPEVCRFCGERNVRLAATFGPDDKGSMHEHWECGTCENTDVRLVKPR
jgi:hypothetical protein